MIILVNNFSFLLFWLCLWFSGTEERCGDRVNIQKIYSTSSLEDRVYQFRGVQKFENFLLHLEAQRSSILH